MIEIYNYEIRLFKQISGKILPKFLTSLKNMVENINHTNNSNNSKLY